MLLHSRWWVVAGVVALCATCAACRPKTTAKPSPKKPVVAAAEAAPSETPQPQPVPKTEPAAKAPARKPKPQPTPPSSAIPKVALSSALRAACIVNVGDTMPEAELPDPTGKTHSLESLYIPKLTIVCFWTIGAAHRSQLVAAAVLQDLMKEVVEPFGKKGVQVVGINVGDPAAAVQKEVGQTGATFPNLLDSKGEFFAKIAKDKKTPRIYLLDAGGRILWFDIENRRQSREDLTQSIQVVLGKL